MKLPRKSLKTQSGGVEGLMTLDFHREVPVLQALRGKWRDTEGLIIEIIMKLFLLNDFAGDSRD